MTRDEFRKLYPDVKETESYVYPCEHTWISVKDRLPENGVKVIVLHDKAVIDVLRTDLIKIGYLGINSNDIFIVGECPRKVLDHITHWMTLPEPPHD